MERTGAGDAFMSGIIYSDLNKLSLEKTSKVASAIAALECTSIGVRDGIPSNFKEIENFIQNNELKQEILLIRN